MTWNSWVFFILCEGFKKEDFDAVFDWSKTKSVSLRFRAQERCSFVSSEEKILDDGPEYKTEVKAFGGKVDITDKVNALGLS